MKKIVLIFVILATFLLKPGEASSVDSLEKVEYIPEEEPYILKTLTVYNPTHKQCDLTPLITASNERIDTVKLRNQQLRWMALSRNLLKRWKGSFSYGDTVRLYVGDPEVDGLWIIQDNLNKRYKDRGDLLFDRKVKSLGIWKNVKLYKV